MKTLAFYFACFVLTLHASAQVSLLAQEVRNLVKRDHPEIGTDQKLIALSIWSDQDKESRACNQAFEKAYTTYFNSKLKGGNKGLILVLLNREDLNEMAIITLGKDGIRHALSYKLSDLKNTTKEFKQNIVYDSDNKIVLKDLNHEQIFDTIHSLITR
ncbi:MAG TPA: hypothetical protein PLQ93_07875 [Bacteroidia bacterium]|nr:hypothetical protein [Bacteroidia bacterium]